MSDGFGQGHPLDPPEFGPAAVSLGPQRLQALLRAGAAVAAECDLPAVLRRVVAVARELVDARYAALGVIGSDGVFDEFVHTGMDPSTIERIGHAPEGRGILGLPTEHSAPVRLGELRAHPASVEFPPHHPTMDSFLGVPIRIRDRAFGTLYLTDSADGAFSAEDEQLVVSLASAAAVAIDSARLRRESARRDRWSAAATEVTRRLLAGDDHPLDLILRYARDTVSADFATLALLIEPGRLRVQATIGAMAEHLVGATANGRVGLADQVTRTRIPVLAAGPVDTVLPAHAGSVIIVPLMAGGTVMGTVNVGRVVGAPAFADADTDDLAGFAERAGVAMELDRTRADLSERIVADDDRIVVDLNDHVVKELFAVALSLQGLFSITPAPEHRARLSRCIDRLDAVVKHIRTTVYDVTHSADRPDDLQDRLRTLLETHEPKLGHPVGIRFTRLTERPLSAALTDDVLTVVGDTITDIARHDGTSRVHLRVDVTTETVLVEITNNGDRHEPLVWTDDTRNGTRRTENAS
jgi:GAF domain-containing protein